VTGFLHCYSNITNYDSDFAFKVLPLKNSLSHRQSINSMYCNCVKTALRKSVYSYLSIDSETKQGLKNKNNCQSLNASLLILIIHRVRSRDTHNYYKDGTCKFLSGSNTLNWISPTLNKMQTVWAEVWWTSDPGEISERWRIRRWSCLWL